MGNNIYIGEAKGSNIVGGSVSGSSLSAGDSSSEDLFESILAAIQQIESPREREKVKQVVLQMKSSTGKPEFKDHYKQFCSFIADHVTILSPYIPQLSALMS